MLGEPGRKGHLLAAEEINAEGGFSASKGSERIADEAAGTDANVKELRRMKLSEKIDLFTGVISSGNTPALGLYAAEELGVLTMFNDGCTDFLFDKAVPQPKYVFRVTNIQSADGVTSRSAQPRPGPRRNGSPPFAGLQLWPQRA